MNISNHTFVLRLAIAIILLVHSLAGLFNNGINDFGNYFLAPLGFGFMGVPVAWAIKISHVVAAFCLLFEKYVKLAGIVTIFILVMGIALIHLWEGWFVVGGGRNGVEFNFLLIAGLLTVMFPDGLKRKEILN